MNHWLVTTADISVSVIPPGTRVSDPGLEQVRKPTPSINQLLATDQRLHTFVHVYMQPACTAIALKIIGFGHL